LGLRGLSHLQGNVSALAETTFRKTYSLHIARGAVEVRDLRMLDYPRTVLLEHRPYDERARNHFGRQLESLLRCDDVAVLFTTNKCYELK
jgi:hypothetical protein